MQTKISIQMLQTDAEIQGIKILQNANLKNKISTEEAKQEGFLTAAYSIEFLQIMNQYTPAIIAKDQDHIVGYALACDKQSMGQHPLLDDLFHQVDKMEFKGKLLSNTNYILVGQLCVAKSHRGIGLVQSMYAFFKTNYASKYSYLITDVDEYNPRSVKAHQKSGFEIINTLHYGGSNWHVVLWDWNKNA